MFGPLSFLSAHRHERILFLIKTGDYKSPLSLPCSLCVSQEPFPSPAPHTAEFPFYISDSCRKNLVELMKEKRGFKCPQFSCRCERSCKPPTSQLVAAEEGCLGCFWRDAICLLHVRNEKISLKRERIMNISPAICLLCVCGYLMLGLGLNCLH